MGINPNNAVILEWAYTPDNFFEEPILIREDEYEIRIEGGRVTATLAPDRYAMGRDTRDELHDHVEGYFRAVQIWTHKSYDLPKPGMSRVYTDGRRDVMAFPETVHLSITGHAPDVRITDSDGNVVADTKCERIDAEKSLAEAFGRLRPTDPILGKLIDSYQAAVNDPDDELVHLYEIRDALGKHFGGRIKAQETLGISKSEWDVLGILACTEPVQQGRHRGEHLVPLRKATAKELEQARTIARRFIDAYVRYADAANS